MIPVMRILRNWVNERDLLEASATEERAKEARLRPEGRKKL